MEIAQGQRRHDGVSRSSLEPEREPHPRLGEVCIDVTVGAAARRVDYGDLSPTATYRPTTLLS